MLYYASKLHSSTDFDIEQDTELWRQLIHRVEQPDESELLWKLWMVTDRFPASSPQAQTYSFPRTWRPTKMIVQTAACYLRVQIIPQQTVFTVISPDHSALENLAALIVNLYDEVTPLSLDKFMDENKTLPVRAAKGFELETGTISSRTFSETVTLDELRSSVFRESDWDLMSISTITSGHEDFPKVPELNLIRASYQACFFLLEEDQSLLHNELAQVNSIFQLTDKVFSGDKQTSNSGQYVSMWGS